MYGARWAADIRGILKYAKHMSSITTAEKKSDQHIEDDLIIEALKLLTTYVQIYLNKKLRAARTKCDANILNVLAPVSKRVIC